MRIIGNIACAVGIAICYAAAAVACILFIGLLASWGKPTSISTVAVFYVAGAVGAGALGKAIPGLVHLITGSYGAVRVVALAFAIILGIGLKGMFSPENDWHDLTLAAIGVIGVGSLNDWILPISLLNGDAP